MPRSRSHRRRRSFSKSRRKDHRDKSRDRSRSHHRKTKDSKKRHHKKDRDKSQDRSRRRSRSDSRRRHKDSKTRSKKHKERSKQHRKEKKSEKRKESKKKEYISKQKKPSSDDGKDRSKDAGHFKYKIGDILKDRYEITDHLGDGTFGRVLEVYDNQKKRKYAAKIIRAVDRYIESAQIESDILFKIQEKDPDSKYGIVKLENAFNYHKNYCMLFEPLSLSLYDFLKKNAYRGFTIDHIQSFARQILISIGFMHSIGLTHTDLKPENILLVTSDKETIKISSKHTDSILKDDRASTRSKSEERNYNIPKNDAVRIIDMGGATWDHEHHSSTINTRQYRAPEVILSCCKWGHESDVWSIGCILIELYTGELFFETHESYEHLAMIEKACGPIPEWMADRAEPKMRQHFCTDASYFEKHGTYFDWPRGASSQESIENVSKMKVIEEVIDQRHKEFTDLLKRMLTIDPSRRITCAQALEHPFFSVDYMQNIFDPIQLNK